MKRVDGLGVFLLILLVVSITILIFPGCKKTAELHYFIPEGFKPWVIYKPGSYWIYLNEKTGSQDCTYVKSISYGVHITGGNGSSDPISRYEWATVSLKGPLFSMMSIDASSASTVDPVQENAYFSLHPCTQGLEKVGFSYVLLVNPVFTLYRYKEIISNSGVKTVYPAEIINGNNFTNVYDLRHEWLTSIGDSMVTEAHMAKSVGIIKFRTYKEKLDTTWSLLRWKVVQ
jgi:hypothetical protein